MDRNVLYFKHLAGLPAKKRESAEMADDKKPTTNRFAVIGPFKDWQFLETVNEIIFDHDDPFDPNLCTGYRDLPVRPQGDGWHIVERRDRSTVWQRLITVSGFSIDLGVA
jgi:hypothetical protein